MLQTYCNVTNILQCAQIFCSMLKQCHNLLQCHKHTAERSDILQYAQTYSSVPKHTATDVPVHSAVSLDIVQHIQTYCNLTKDIANAPNVLAMTVMSLIGWTRRLHAV